MTLMAVSTSSGSVIADARPQPAAAAGHRNSRACEKPTESDATEATRANQVIQPTRNPGSEPKAVRV